MSWTRSLIKLSAHEVEQLQKRLREVEDRRAAVQARLEALAAEQAAELARAREFAEAGLYMAGFSQGCAQRRDRLLAEMKGLDLEARGARDALTEAFEAQKKYEHVAERLRLTEVAAAGRRENAQLDELALRRAVGQ